MSQAVQQRLHPLQLQGRAEETRENQPPGSQGGRVRLRDPAALQILVHQPLVQRGQVLLNRLQAVRKIQTASVKLFL